MRFGVPAAMRGAPLERSRMPAELNSKSKNKLQ
jgi:hypothetical protein